MFRFIMIHPVYTICAIWLSCSSWAIKWTQIFPSGLDRLRDECVIPALTPNMPPNIFCVLRLVIATGLAAKCAPMLQKKFASVMRITHLAQLKTLAATIGVLLANGLMLGMF